MKMEKFLFEVKSRAAATAAQKVQGTTIKTIYSWYLYRHKVSVARRITMFFAITALPLRKVRHTHSHVPWEGVMKNEEKKFCK